MTTIFALPGSLREQSYNRRLAEAAVELAPADVEVQVGTLRGVPPFDQDGEDEALQEPALASLVEGVAAADALLVVTPEYNKGMPGVLKNGLDWLTRTSPSSVLRDKPAAVMGATTGAWGTRIAQHQLRNALVSCGCLVRMGPQVYVRGAADAFDGDRLVDDDTRGLVADLVADLATWSRRVAGS